MTTNPICGRRHLVPGLDRRERDLFERSAPAVYTPPCVEPAGHDVGPERTKHCAEDGTEWEATR